MRLSLHPSSYLIIITSLWYHCSWITNEELKLRKADSLAHGHTWLHMVVNNRTEICAQVCLFLKSILFLCHHSITSITSVASYLADPKEAQELPGHVLLVSWTSESLQTSFLFFSPLPIFLIYHHFFLAASTYLKFESLSLESVILAHFYLDLFSLLTCMPSSSAVSEAKALPPKSSPMEPLSQTHHYLLF